MFDVFYIGKAPGLFPHEQPVGSIEEAQQLSRTRFFWVVNYLCDYRNFDFLWEPVPWENHQRHAWPSQWQKDSTTYLVPKQGFTDTNYHNNGEIRRTVSMDHWTIPMGIDTSDFDFSWHPDPTDPPYIYQFGTQHQRAGGPQYVVPGATEVKYIKTQHAMALPLSDLSLHWIIPAGIDTSEFDFSWHPDPTDPPYIYQFGTQWQKAGGPQYVVPSATKIKYVRSMHVVVPPPDDLTLNWEIPTGIDTSAFDFSWHPDPTDPPYIYQFGTQHQRTGGPRYIVPGAAEVKYTNQVKAQINFVATTVYLIDHMDGNANAVREQIETKITVEKVSRYFDNYLDTLRRLVRSIPEEQEFVWICSTVCDYANFDFTWHPEKWQANMLHVFASGNEKFGDTFYMHVPTFRTNAERCQLLDWYDLNFVEDISVPRRPMPRVKHNYDTQPIAVQNLEFNGPLALFMTNDAPAINREPVVPLWREKTKTITPLDLGGCAVIVPKVAVPYIKRQLYDYPHIDKFLYSKEPDRPLDIVFISNGESNADANWQHLIHAVGSHGLNRKIVRVDGVNGRAAAYRAAADASTTPWFFAVFAKLKVDENFRWAWQPDRMQQPKHYIFHAKNPVNGLVYGHQAMIAYNKQLVYENKAQGLDFTLDQEHEVVPLLSGVAAYNDSAWTCWRTAFREVLKLKHSEPDIETEYRLQQWLTVGNGQFGDWSLVGAHDAVDFYNSVNGSFDELKKSYEWDWLASYALVKRNLIPSL